MADTPKITYVKGRGLVEVSRLIFAAKDIEIIEEYVTSKAEFENLRATGKLMFMQLPLVEVDGLCLIESLAQENYLGLKYNMIGSTNDEKGRVYMLHTGARSFHYACQPSWILFQPEEKWADCLEEAILKARTRYLPAFEKALKENGSGFMVGSSVTIADCALFNILSYIDEGSEYGNLLDEFPLCKTFVSTFSNLPGVKKYLNSPRRFPPPDKEYAKDALAILY